MRCSLLPVSFAGYAIGDVRSSPSRRVRGLACPLYFFVLMICVGLCFFFSSRRRHTRYWRDWSSDVCSSDLQIHARGLTLINDYFGTLRVRDKVVTSMRLMDAGLPTPEAYYAASAEQLRAVVEDYPIVVKPNSGRRGQQISVVRGAEELEKLDLSYGDIFAQRFVPGGGLDLKAYVVGEEVFGVARPFPVRTAEQKRGEPRAISPEVRDICLRCGELFDLELYGVDLIETEDGPYEIGRAS